MNDSHVSKSPAEFTQRANALLNRALRASAKHDGGDLTALNRCMNHAKAKRMTWIEGLEYSVDALNASASSL
jgi:hypothetical protein